MQPANERLALVQMDITILREQLDHVDEQPHPDLARQFLRRELLSSQMMYHALIRKRRRKLVSKAIGA